LGTLTRYKCIHCNPHRNTSLKNIIKFIEDFTRSTPLISSALAVGNISDSIANQQFFKLNTKEWITAYELINHSILLNINDKNTTIKSLIIFLITFILIMLGLVAFWDIIWM